MINAREIVRRLGENNFSALFAGGCVRDMVMGIEPKDYDIATDARPGDVMSIFKRTIPVGEKFGVVLVIMGGKEYEVATFRTDFGYVDGRHPGEVRFCSEAEDAKRRDFTINGMFYDPKRDKIIDYIGGRDDLKKGVIRAIGDPHKRIEEDKLRIMRGLRFAVRFDFKIEPETKKAIKELAPKITQVSIERIRDEFLKILTEGRAAAGIKLMLDLGLMDYVLPEIPLMIGVEQPPNFHPEGDVMTHTMIMLENMVNPTPRFALAVLLHDVGKPKTFKIRERIRFDRHTTVGANMAKTICKRLKIPVKDMDVITEIIKEHLKFKDIKKMRESRLKRFLRGDNFDEHLELHRLDCLASHGDLGSWEFCREKLEEFSKEDMRPEPLFRGRDLIEMGLTPGPIFKEILSYVEDAQLEGRIKTREEACGLVREYLRGIEN